MTLPDQIAAEAKALETKAFRALVSGDEAKSKELLKDAEFALKLSRALRESEKVLNGRTKRVTLTLEFEDGSSVRQEASDEH